MCTPLRGPDLIEEIGNVSAPDGGLTLWWLGQASVALRIGDAVIYIDPFLSESAQRLVPPPCSGDDVTNADLILLTHGHSDHLDAAALPLIATASPGATIVAPRPLVPRVAALVGDAGRILPAEAGVPIGWRGLRIVPIIAKHEAFDMHPHLGYPYLGYVLLGRNIGLYHAGDTVPYEGLVDSLARLPVDLALLPINGRDYFRTQRGTAGNMDSREAAELASLLNVDTAIPIHYGMFAGNTASPGDFVERLQAIAPHIHALIPGLARPCRYLPPRPRRPAGTAQAPAPP